ncbi:hypothetical protein LOK49_LG07G02328 [Camellia lanceoleosa]|uniref:Uncharacterized protein n=1 Tax=Camellia lanceoleosa TaxID=1840588 RepID=A0ACC0H7I0_9ERIC|nr:hypothetical protein LOK49_LG07G02328 [Camellia lanceoleosa]
MPTTSRARSLAAMRVQRIDSLVVPCLIPPPVPENIKDLGSLSMLASQSMTTISSSVAAGEASQLKHVQSMSPRNAAELTVAGKKAKKLGLSQWVMPGINDTLLNIFDYGFKRFGSIRGGFGETGSEIDSQVELG